MNTTFPELKTFTFDFAAARKRMDGVVTKTPLQRNYLLSNKYQCNIYLKREDLQLVRSYKLRGAFNLLNSLSLEELSNGVVCASAGNHAQGFAYCCNNLHINGIVFMPVNTPKQKIKQTKLFGNGHIEVKLVGDTYDDCAAAAQEFCRAKNMRFIHAFDDEKIIEGQGTVAYEIFNDLPDIDYVFVPIGGGGLASGVSSYLHDVSPETIIIGAEPEGATSMIAALHAGGPVQLENIDPFVDGAAVKKVGERTYAICRELLAKVVPVAEGKVCTTILELYNNDAIVVEPAGALSIACLDEFAREIKGKNVVCIVSGGNNDISRMQEIKERSLLYERLKHYFLVNFSQRPSALKEFVNSVLGPTDDITRFEYMKKHNKDFGPALIGIEVRNKEDYLEIIKRMKERKFVFRELNQDDTLFNYIV